MRPKLALVLMAFVVAGCTVWPGRTASQRLQGLERRGDAAYETGRYLQAASHWNEALALARESGERATTARLLIGLAFAEEGSGRYQQALARGEEGLRLAQLLRDEALEAMARSAMAKAYRRLGRYAEAEPALARALATARQLGNARIETDALQSLGAIHQARGDYGQAQSTYEQSLARSRQAGYAAGEAAALNNLGGLQRLRGNYGQALTLYQQSLALRQRLGDVGGQGRLLGNLCLVYLNLGEIDQARRSCERSLRIAREVGDRAREANNLNNLGGIYRRLGQDRKALSYYQRSLTIKGLLADRAGEGRSLNNIGELNWQLGRPQRASEYFARSLEIKKALGDKPGESATHYNLGELALSLGQQDKALHHFRRTLELESEMGQKELLWRAFHGLSRTSAAKGRDQLAILFGKQAVNALQSVRTGIRGLDKALQRSYVEDKQQAYRDLIDLLLDSGRLLEAQQVMSMLKEEEYFDFLRRDAAEDPRTTRASFAASESPWEQRYRELSGELTRVATEISTLKDKDPAQLTEREQARLEQLDQLLQDTLAAFDDYLDALEASFIAVGPERAKQFGEKDLKGLLVFQQDLQDLGRGAVLVHYLVGDEHLNIIVTGPNVDVPPIPHKSAIGRGQLTGLIAAYREKLQNPRSDPLPEAQALYRHLVAPLEADLETLGAKVLMVYLDEALRYLPLAALHDDRGYLAERYATVLYTTVVKGRGLHTPPTPHWRVAGLGVSQRVVDEFGPLPAVVYELDAIVKEGADDTAGIWPGRVYVDAAFTKKELRQVLRQRYPVVHLASHFKFQPGTEEDSFLLLGDGEPLSLAELEGYRFAGVDLLTLSACETAKGGGDADGREVESFGALAQMRNARGVLATLWSVADRSTALFMERFYARKKEQGETKAEALRRTQVEFIHGERVGGANDQGSTDRGVVIPGSPARSAGYSHPYFWAPFILMGNWL